MRSTSIFAHQTRERGPFDRQRETKPMKTSVPLLLATLALPACPASLPARAISFGPMLHWNFGGGDVKFSWALEAAYWQTVGDPPSGNSHLHGIDVGMEFEGDTRRIYAEYQRGEIVFGGSVGPVLEFTESSSQFGVQAGVWGAVFAGGDLRMRYVGKDGFAFAPGVFLKLPADLNNGDYGVRGN